ncbi:hypothetical protein [Modestobacter altitudinis]|nr:hypothetical protein [Modestobacter altitudinis]
MASLEQLLEREACGHDGSATCSLCRVVMGLGFLPAAAAAGQPRSQRA